MDVNRDEAKAALSEIDSLIRITKQRLAHGPAGQLLVVWGLIWAIIFLGVHFFPHFVNWLAPLGCAVGMAAMWIFKRSDEIETRGGLRASDGRIRLAWLILTGYSIVWMIILHPQREPDPRVAKLIDVINHVLAFFASIGMFGYVVAGLWLGRFWIVLGLTVTCLILLGLYAIPQFFLIWMAVVGGGALIFSGVMVKRLWVV